MGGHFLLQETFLTQGSNPHLLHWQGDSLPLGPQGSPWFYQLLGETLKSPDELVGLSISPFSDRFCLMCFEAVLLITYT